MKHGTNLIKKNTILCIAGHFPPCGASGVFRTLGFIRYLVQHNWEISVLTLNNIREERTDIHLLDKVPSSVHIHRTGYFDIFSIKNKLTPKTDRQQKTMLKTDNLISQTCSEDLFSTGLKTDGQQKTMPKTI